MSFTTTGYAWGGLSGFLVLFPDAKDSTMWHFLKRGGL